MKIPRKVVPLDNYHLYIEFHDEVKGVVDLSYLKGKGVFGFWNEDTFKKIKIGDFGELIWNDDVEICSDNLYLKLSGKSVEEVFQGSEQEQTHA